MAQDLGTIMQSLDAGYNPQRQSINDQISSLPSQAAAQTAGLQAQQNTAFDSIQNGAQDRGMGFSGIPLQEQAKYTADTFLPAVAKVQESQNNAKSSLTDALNNVNLQQRTQAIGVQQHQQDLEQQQAQFEAQQAADLAKIRAASSGGSGGLGDLFSGLDTTTPDPSAGATVPAAPQASFKQRSDGGYMFTDHNGKGVNAAQYAQLTGTPLRTLLSQMAASGDNGAKAALGFIGGDGNADPRKITSPQLASLYTALTGRGIGVYKPPAPSIHNQIVAKVKGVPGSFTVPGSSTSKVQQQLNAARAAGKVR